MIIKKKQFLFPSTHFAQKFNISSDFLSSSLALVEHDREVFTSLVRNDRSESIVYAAVFASRATHTWIEEGAADHVPLSPRRGSVTIREFAMRRRRCTPSFLHRCICYWICLKLFEFDQRMCLKSCTIFERRWREEERGWRGVFSSSIVGSNLLKKIFVFVRNFSMQDRLLKIVCY